MLGGSARQKILFLVLVGIYAIGVQFSATDKLERVGQPDVGWVVEFRNAISPSRLDASDLGLRGGGRGLAVNGVELAPHEFEARSLELLRRDPGASNTLRFARRGEILEVEIPVRNWTWRDALFTKGAIDVLALLFMVTALVSFVLRPYEPTSWAILSLSSLTGGLLTAALIPETSVVAYHAAYRFALSGLAASAVLHTALAFPVIHPLLVRSSATLVAIYGLGALVSAARLVFGKPAWGFDYVGVFGTALLLASILFLVARCSVLSARVRDRLIAQRARILLVGGIFGASPVALSLYLQNATEGTTIDIRYTYWALSLFFLPLGYVSVRQSLVNAAAAVRRAIAYGALAGLLTLLGVLVVEVQAYALALLLFPLLYWWPRFDQRLNARLYPRRARFPVLLQEVGGEMAASASVDELLEALVTAPTRFCDAQSAVVFLLPDVAGPDERVRSCGEVMPLGDAPLAHETLVKLMVTTRREIFREQIAVEPQYANIRDECYAGFERLGAELILPILREGQVIGGLAPGLRRTGDLYEPPEVFALQTTAQQAVQALSRVETLQRLRAREDEFSELKRFFPPQIIDQVMEQGGAAELRSRRKRVTVFFADLRGFTAFSERVEPEEVMATLAEYHAAMGKRIAEFGGTLERFAGDGFMVFFNDPVEQADHVERAVRMALCMQRDAAKLREQWNQRGYKIDVGMGVHTGFATVGFVGYEGRLDYAVIGTVTNLAARLSDAAGGGEILVTGSVRQELSGEFFTEPAGDISLKGISQPQPIHRMLASKALREAAS